VKLYSDLPIAIFEYTIGPIPYEDKVGKEVVSRFTTDLKSNATWYTDSNGREMQKRIRNYRPTWKWYDSEPVAGNYYPVPSRIYIRDEDHGVQLTVLTDRAQGGSSLKDGELELMVHRRLFDDDGKGLDEALNEPGQFGDGLIVRGSHYVILDNFNNSTLCHRLLGEKLLLKSQPFISTFPVSPSEWMAKFPTQYSGLARDLPPNVHLLTLERLDHTHHLLRLEHQFQSNEQPYNNTVTVQLADLFTTMKVVDVVELGLGANAALSDIHRLHWNTDAYGAKGRYQSAEAKMKSPFIVELKPMEIHTFNITVEYTI
jgi:lysosomal alpha-mannosidase